MTEKLQRIIEAAAWENGNRLLLNGGAALLNAWVEAAEAGKFDGQYTPEEITSIVSRTRARARELRQAARMGSPENADLN